MPNLPPAPPEQPHGTADAPPQQTGLTLQSAGHQELPEPLPDSAAWRPPASVPISESENPDAIALRAAISILQTQRDRAAADLRLLESVKQRAVQAPDEFMEAAKVQAAQLNTQPDTMDLDSDEGSSESEDDGSFPSLPTAQNVVRCPPVNWAKYHIVPETLDKLHAVQQMRPDSGLPYNVVQPGMPPGVTGSMNGTDAKVPPRPPTVAAPYSPFLDGRLEGMRTRNQGRRDKDK